MRNVELQKAAAEVTEVTFKLLADCQAKEERLANQLDISIPEFRTLRLFRNERRLQIKELVKRAGLSGSRLTRILDGLEKKGFLSRSIDLTDRRSILVTLSSKGESLAETLKTRYIRIHEEILQEIPEEMHETVLVSWTKMLGSLDKWIKSS